MVDKTFTCNLCRDRIYPEGEGKPTGTGIIWIAGFHRFRLTGLDAANNHICWPCIKAVAEHDRALETTQQSGEQ